MFIHDFDKNVEMNYLSISIITQGP